LPSSTRGPGARLGGRDANLHNNKGQTGGLALQFDIGGEK